MYIKRAQRMCKITSTRRPKSPSQERYSQRAPDSDERSSTLYYWRSRNILQGDLELRQRESWTTIWSSTVNRYSSPCDNEATRRRIRQSGAIRIAYLRRSKWDRNYSLGCRDETTWLLGRCYRNVTPFLNIDKRCPFLSDISGNTTDCSFIFIPSYP